MSFNTLQKNLNDLISFLDANDCEKWAQMLSEVLDKLKHPNTQEDARSRLDSMFGGMGSLNDLVFTDENLNSKFDDLANAVFRENRLMDANFMQRSIWRLYELTQNKDIPLRIRKSFAK